MITSDTRGDIEEFPSRIGKFDALLDNLEPDEAYLMAFGNAMRVFDTQRYDKGVNLRWPIPEFNPEAFEIEDLWKYYPMPVMTFGTTNLILTRDIEDFSRFLEKNSIDENLDIGDISIETPDNTKVHLFGKAGLPSIFRNCFN